MLCTHIHIEFAVKLDMHTHADSMRMHSTLAKLVVEEENEEHTDPIHYT